jgi:hypothetical protein
MKLFIQHLAKNGSAEIIRLKLNANHPYNTELERMGFIKKLDGDVFQTFIPNSINFIVPMKWLLTRGDKDT